MRSQNFYFGIGNSALCFLIICSAFSLMTVKAGLLDDTKNLIKDAKKEAEKALGGGVNVCLSNDNCNKDFFNLNNYCCTISCCNWFEYVFRNDNQWDNFKDTLNQPRAINIILFVIAIIVISSLLSMIVSFVCCFFGCSKCCCGSRKYSIVSH
ncbi:unnamed protein product [Brachionus calyciflorus]|uniref:Uncharacterized protein n=1 Tax=Brachionus calyciflorus TaxID=104777 RepID=A0A814AMQ9_9BILA|nr:unnamed protein product [Brachionus calyciflorus]